MNLSRWLNPKPRAPLEVIAIEPAPRDAGQKIGLSGLLSPEARASLEASVAREAERKAQREAEMRSYEEEHSKIEKLRKQFLEDCEAIHLVEPEVYALFLIAWLNQGDEITHHYDYPLKSAGFYMPTKSTSIPIPAGYGVQALDLLIVGDLVEFNFKSTSGDVRSGWEFGHSTVLGWKTKITPDGIQKVVAFTNQPDSVAIYSDVAAILLSGEAIEMVRRSGLIAEDQLSGFAEINKKPLEILAN